jgi:hypothetical protein
VDEVIDVRAVFQQNHRDLAIATMPTLLVPRKGRYDLPNDSLIDEIGVTQHFERDSPGRADSLSRKCCRNHNEWAQRDSNPQRLRSGPVHNNTDRTSIKSLRYQSGTSDRGPRVP